MRRARVEQTLKSRKCLRESAAPAPRTCTRVYSACESANSASGGVTGVNTTAMKVASVFTGLGGLDLGYVRAFADSRLTARSSKIGTSNTRVNAWSVPSIA